MDDEKLVLSSGGMTNTFTRQPQSKTENESSSSDSAAASEQVPDPTPEPTDDPVPESTPEPTPEPAPDSHSKSQAEYVTDWNDIAAEYYQIYLSYLDFINNGGDTGRLINVEPEQKARFEENYEKYNAGDLFYNRIFEFDVTASSLSDKGNGVYEADCYVHVVNSDTEIKSGNISENDVTIHAKLRYDPQISAWILTSQKGESYSYSGHQMIRYGG
ncbi:MAG: hypothetical protein K6G61_06710 [Solobacterium sp.]|nr:hypothetical protein [Solobacterium sp.]